MGDGVGTLNFRVHCKLQKASNDYRLCRNTVAITVQLQNV